MGLTLNVNKNTSIQKQTNKQLNALKEREISIFNSRNGTVE